MPRKQIGIKLDEQVLAQIDQTRGGTTRTAFIESAVLLQLADVPVKDHMKETAHVPSAAKFHQPKVSRSEAFAKATQR